jgi:ribonuclease HII
MIRRWAPVYPEYDLASNKGYRSPKHLAALNELGPTPLHRLSFAPVWMSQGSQQEAFEFEDDDLVDDEIIDDDEVLAVDSVSGIP